MYDQMTCQKCGFNPKEQNKNSENFESEHWKVVRNIEYFPSEDSMKSWQEIFCPICNEMVYSNL